MTATVDAMGLARDERADLADFLATLSPDQWDAPSLCAGWRVRDVVAHMFSYEGLGPIGLVGRFLRGGVLPDRVNAAGVAALADHTPEQLLALVRHHQQPRGLTAGFGGRIALTDGVIHHQDIRRPLGLPRTIPAERMRTVLDFARTAPPSGRGNGSAGSPSPPPTSTGPRATARWSKARPSRCSWPWRAVAESPRSWPGPGRPG